MRSSKVLFIGVAWLLASAGCASQPPVVRPSVFRPSAETMEPAPTQYLLSPEQQRTSAKRQKSSATAR